MKPLASKDHRWGAAFRMIRPVLYVDLPGIIRALDDRARARHSAFADFVVAPDYEEPHSGLAALLCTFLPITPHALTWICEDHWRLLGVAQAQRRPGAHAWDLTYLAAILSATLSANGQGPAPHLDDVHMELLQYALNAAIGQSVQRFFARVQDDRVELEIFAKLGFQRYASELSYWLSTATDGLAALGADDAALVASRAQGARWWARTRRRLGLDSVEMIQPEVPLRPWYRHDAWGLLRLYDGTTPKRVQLAESLTSDELVHTRAAGGRTRHLPLLEPATAAYVNDHGVRLGGWMRLRYGRGSLPHVLSLMAHPDDPEVAPALLRAALELLAREPARPILCQVRDYETAVVSALRAAAFEHTATHALLIRHLTARALRRREMAAMEPRLVYGVKGLGTASSTLSEGEKTYYAREKR